MAAEEERHYLKTMGDPRQQEEWSRQVDQMTDSQVIHVYLEFKKAEEEA